MGNLLPVRSSTLLLSPKADLYADAQEMYQNFNAICFIRTQRSVKRKKTRAAGKLKEI
jgi:hypothetical protein